MDKLNIIKARMLEALRAGLVEAQRRRAAFEERQAKHARKADHQDQQSEH